MKFVYFNSRHYPNAGKIPMYTNMVMLDIYQQEADEIIIGEAPQATNITGIGRFNIICVAPTGGDTPSAEVFVTQDAIMQITSEFRLAELNETELDEADSVVTWVKVGDNTSNTTGRFEIFSPVTAFKIKFTGTAGGKVSISLN